jgi:hypothetical protein
VVSRVAREAGGGISRQPARGGGEMRALIFYIALRPLIAVNYWLRERGLAKDKWFWADTLALSWGYALECPK